MQDSAATPLSSRDYLEQLRQRRLNRVESTQVQPVTTDPIQAPSQPLSETAPVLPATEPPVQFTTQPPIVPVFPATVEPALPPSPSSYNPASPPSTQPMTAAEIEAENQRRSAFRESELFPGQFVPVPEETILEWKAPSRPFKKRNRQFYTTVAIITGLISLILFFAGQFLPIAVVIAVAFLAYVLSSVPPEEVTNKITTWGIHTEEKLYYWEEMGRFWLDEKFGQRLLHVEIARFPGRLTVLLANQNEADLTQLLSEVLLNEKPKDTFYDKAAKWLQDKIPLDTD